jgi:hypothetical protein
LKGVLLLHPLLESKREREGGNVHTHAIPTGKKKVVVVGGGRKKSKIEEHLYL